MNEKLIDNWNNVVKPIDQVYVLGDFAWGNYESVSKIFNRLNGTRFLIQGNHDDEGIHKKLKWAWIKDVYELKANDKYYFLSHYPHRSWNKAVHGARHCFAHCHGTLKPWGYSFDVGTDCWNYTPISIDTVEQLIAKLPRINPEYSPSFMPKGEKWNGGKHMLDFPTCFVGDGSLDNKTPEEVTEA